MATQPIPDNYRANEYEYTLLEHTMIADDSAVGVYRQEGLKNTNEVVILRWLPETTMFGRTVPARWKIPGNEDFGKTGWCCVGEEHTKLRYDAAILKEQRRLQRQKEKQQPNPQSSIA